jgi:hypothetical protein
MVAQGRGIDHDGHVVFQKLKWPTFCWLSQPLGDDRWWWSEKPITKIKQGVTTQQDIERIAS